jgi:hypothetical protein
LSIPTVIVSSGSISSLGCSVQYRPAQSIQSSAPERIDGNSTILLTSIISAVFDHLITAHICIAAEVWALSFKIPFQDVQILELSSKNRRATLSVIHIYT